MSDVKFPIDFGETEFVEIGFELKFPGSLSANTQYVYKGVFKTVGEDSPLKDLQF